MLHTYFIDYEFGGTFGDGPNPIILYDCVPKNAVRTYRGGRVGAFYVFSKQEKSPEDLSKIVAEAVGNLPKGLSFKQFMDQVYAALESKGLKKFEYLNHGTLDQKIIYDENNPERTGIREPVLQY